jgi:hypothetical protein
MPRSVTRKISRDVQDAASDIRHVLRKAAPRIRHDGREALAEGARRLWVAARGVTAQVGARSKVIATGAVREARVRPLATGAIVAAIAALIGLAAFARRSTRTA